MDRTELLGKIRAGREQFEKALARLSEAQLIGKRMSNGWTGKDTLAHFMSWERRAAYLYNTLVSGGTPDAIRTEDEVDAHNARFYDENRDLPLADVQRMEREAYEALLHIAETAPEHDLFDAKRFPWTDGRPFYDIIAGDTYEHYDEHLKLLTELENRN